MSHQRIVIVANGHLPDLESAKPLFHKDDFIIAADGGANYLTEMGILPNLLIGDLDSVHAEVLRVLENEAVQIIKHPAGKDETDLELAVYAAVAKDADEILVIGALGGRLDQTLGNLSLLSAPAFAGRRIRLDDGEQEAFFCRKQVQVRGRSGDTVSLLPWGVPVSGIHTEGLRWPLSNETLYPEKTRGISNALTGESASIQIRSGLLLVIHQRSIINRKSNWSSI
ncbi:MAG: thiamine diphosphokinase [Anaerolineales bacterium]